MRQLRRALVLMLLLLLTDGPAGAKTRKGEKFLVTGREAEIRKQYEVALQNYESAMLEDPSDPAYQLAARRVRFQAGMARVDTGQKLRLQGKLEEALIEFQRGYAIDPSSSIAQQELQRTMEMITRNKKAPGETAPEARAMTPSELANKEAEDKSASMLPAPELKPITRQISTLKMNNQPVRVLYETVGKLAGINVVMDPEYTPAGAKTTFTVDLSNTTLEEALDFLAVQTKSFWKPLSSNTIFVAAENPTKRREYEDYVVKVFYIKNATTIQELQEISTTIRSVTEIRRAFVYNPQNAILIKGTVDQVALAEKLIQDLDKPKSEVVVDVIVMEANRSRVRDLAASLTTAGAAGLNVPISYNKEGGVNIQQFKSLGLGDFSLAVPGALIQALLSDSTTRVLQQPQVRAVENYKAQLRIGDKIPYASGSYGGGFGGNIGGVGGAPGQVGGGFGGLGAFGSTQFAFAEVGVNVDITPKVHTRDEVSMHVEIEISNVSSRVSLGGFDQPVISQKKIVHDIRIREGEVNLLGGLMNQQESRTISGIPGLAEIPIIGRLFGTEKVDRSQGELLIALIPHIVRYPDYSEANLKGIAAGSDVITKLTYAPRKETPPDPAAPSRPVTPAPEPPTPTTPAPTSTVPVTPTPGTAARLFFSPSTVQTQLSSPVVVTLQVENVTDLFTAPMKIKFDPKLLRLTSVRQGTLLAGDGQQVNFSENTLNDAGEASVTLNRLPGSGGVSGSGSLLTFSFLAVGRGTSQVTLSEAALRNSQLQQIAAPMPSLNIVIQ